MEKKVSYIADDGTEFKNEDDCVIHDEYLKFMMKTKITTISKKDFVKLQEYFDENTVYFHKVKKLTKHLKYDPTDHYLYNDQ